MMAGGGVAQNYFPVFSIGSLNIRLEYFLKILKAKKLACQNYIDRSANKCRTAWNVISGENTPNQTCAVPLDLKLLNNFFLDSVQE